MGSPASPVRGKASAEAADSHLVPRLFPTVSALLLRYSPLAFIGRRFLPKGWPDFLKQLAIFAIFDIAYEGSRALAEGQETAAFRHGHDVVDAEKTLGIFRELNVQQWVLGAPHIVLDV